MKKIIFISFLISIILAETLPLSKKYILSERDDHFNRGTYLIVLSNSSLNNIILSHFVSLKKTQGFDVEVVSFREGDEDEGIYGIEGQTNDDLRNYLIGYYSADPMLEYVLLVGDVNQNNNDYNIPTYEIPSYNETENDQTDYPYTFFDIGEGEDILSPHFFIGRWSIQDQSELLAIISRTIGYSRLVHPVTGDSLNTDYLNDALIVAGNFSDTPGVAWPVTPVWTSKWLKDRLVDFNYSNIDEFYFTASNPNEDQTSEITSAWSDGVGIINYRGWGDASGWKKPIFKKEHLEDLSNGWELPVVFSFVCNTGDFGNDFSGTGLNKCFGEVMVTAGSVINPKGAAAMIGPSDLDTDTRFNNVICGAMWDGLLEHKVNELAPALHAGKHALIYEFSGLSAPDGTVIDAFYHHVYGVLGDPSLPVWLLEPNNINLSKYLFLPLLTALCFAGYQLFTKVIAKNKEPFVALFYTGILGSIIFSIVAFFNWTPIEHNHVWLVLFLLGFIGFISHYMFAHALQLLDLSYITNFQYSQLIWASLINVYFFNDPIGINKIIGIILIIIIGIIFIETQNKSRIQKS